MNILTEVAAGRRKADLVLKNARVVDVFCERIIECDVAICGSRIAGLGSYSAADEIDLCGKYLMPSFIDSHLHIESTMLTPLEYSRLAAPHGVTTLIADPHEIANVCGEAGLSFMIENAKNSPLDIRFMLPSCVPATPFEPSGAEIDVAEAARLRDKYGFFGLGEMMNSFGIVSGDESVIGKLDGFSIIDGHAPLLSGNLLSAYAAAGIHTDHECSSPEEMREKLSLGMYVHMREGSQAKNVASLVSGLNGPEIGRVTFCTDDRNIHDISAFGSISNCIREAIKAGLSPITAIRIATRNAAECYGLSDRGAVAPGRLADLVVASSLEELSICAVYKDGRLISDGKKALFASSPASPDEAVLHTVRLPEITAHDFEYEFDPSLPVIGLIENQLITTALYPDSPEGLNRVAVIERYGRSGHIGRAFVSGFRLKGGAVAQSIGHDSHNVTVVGDSPEDMALAVNALGRDGGIAVVQDGKVTASLTLEVAGIISTESFEKVEENHAALFDALSKLDYDRRFDPLIMLSFLSLPVIPDLKLISDGLFDVTKMELVKPHE